MITCMFDSLVDLMASLAKLKQCGAASIYPGHGPVVDDAAAKILEYITHRQQREDEILAVLKKHKRLTSSEVVDNIYDPLPYLLRLSARKATEKHLQKQKLLLEYRVQRQAGWFQAATY
ncbi:Beta-lactamase-like protein 2 [Phytophthora citrophthora]|uniref:Beta-lactamase-like protein 2 n=1 Tax=Phytophthora citrophthora TaxID=4793 RepID=A0AAD9GEJ5_9STRA|nr:Beta-lactamase-like protein 2 [Phytophthora citrophthora]